MKNILLILVLFISLLGIGGCSKPQSSQQPPSNNIVLEKELTLNDSKNELSEIEDSITDENGNLKYISGEIVSDAKRVTIKMKNSDAGEINNQEIEVYEFNFITMDNKSHKVYLDIENITDENKRYQIGDSIYYSFSDTLNSAWYIGEGKEVIYLSILEN
ncbi:hypothetical protein ABHA37_08220 [Clostridium tertium]|uniref:hypothetical protein n=1 Tax=Clostridium TaxID=1485 RepID=UPI00232E8AAC|nr:MULTISPECIES: hypothetical protein [Clostridium]MDB1923398.1 hypothetical protein [Clostridium tertium]MDB1930003.1 hypothetical protein [Clostridium tertium]MDU7948691.1 hypothetical protein [Clostridium sp.]